MKKKPHKDQWEEDARADVDQQFAPGGPMEHCDQLPLPAQLDAIRAVIEDAIKSRNWLNVVFAEVAIKKAIAVATAQWVRSGPPDIGTVN